MSDITFRMATDADLPTIIAMLADDEIAENRENAAVPDHYRDAFAAMAKEVFNKMLLAEQDGKIVGSLQLVFVPGVSRNGTKRFCSTACQNRVKAASFRARKLSVE